MMMIIIMMLMLMLIGDCALMVARTLTNEEATIAKDLYVRGYSQRKIAIRFGVTANLMNRIVWGESYRDIPWPNGRCGGYEEAYPNMTVQANNMRTPFARKTEPREPRESGGSGGYSIDDNDNRSSLNYGASKGIISGEVPEDLSAGRKKILADGTEIEPMTPEMRKLALEAIAKVEDDIEKKAWEDIKKNAKETGVTAEEVDREIKEAQDAASPWGVGYISIKEIKEREPNNSFVRLLEEEQDDILERAIGIVFKALPQDQWDGDLVVSMVQKVSKSLEETQER